MHRAAAMMPSLTANMYRHACHMAYAITPGLPLWTEAPDITPKGVDFVFIFYGIAAQCIDVGIIGKQETRCWPAGSAAALPKLQVCAAEVPRISCKIMFIQADADIIDDRDLHCKANNEM